VTAEGQGASRIEVQPPPGWRVAAPWASLRGGYSAGNIDELEGTRRRDRRCAG